MLYKPVRVVVASAQRENLKSQINQKYLPVKIDLKDTAPADTLLLTRGQIANIEKARTLGRRKYKTIRMSRKQIEKNRSYQGGFLNYNDDDDDKGKDLSASTTLSSFIDADDGFYLIKREHFMKVYPVQDDNGLHLKTTHPLTSYVVFKDGLYLKRGKSIEKGEDIAKNGPFKNYPILGWIL